MMESIKKLSELQYTYVVGDLKKVLLRVFTKEISPVIIRVPLNKAGVMENFVKEFQSMLEEGYDLICEPQKVVTIIVDDITYLQYEIRVNLDAIDEAVCLIQRGGRECAMFEIHEDYLYSLENYLASHPYGVTRMYIERICLSQPDENKKDSNTVYVFLYKDPLIQILLNQMDTCTDLVKRAYLTGKILGYSEKAISEHISDVLAEVLETTDETPDENCTNILRHVNEVDLVGNAPVEESYILWEN